jgi:hypothetical protein
MARSRVDDVPGSGIYPRTGPFPESAATGQSPAAFAHPEERERIRLAFERDLPAATTERPVMIHEVRSTSGHHDGEICSLGFRHSDGGHGF